MIQAFFLVHRSFHANMLMVLFARRHTKSTVVVRERPCNAQKNVIIFIPFSAHSKEMQKHLISFEDDERQHKRRFVVKKLTAFKFRDEHLALFTRSKITPSLSRVTS